MAGFITVCLLSTVMIAITSLITYEILRIVWSAMPRMHVAPRLRVVLILVPIFAVHILNIWIYGVIYFLIEHYTTLGQLSGAIPPLTFSYESFVDRLYFSSATYTTLWIGDITPTKNLRMLASAEVLNALVIVGWTISFTYLAMERFWSLPHYHPKPQSESRHG